MKNNVEKYSYRVFWSDDDQEFVAVCAEFNGLSWLDETPEKALKGIGKVVTDVIEMMSKDGDKIPEPIGTKKFSGKFQVRITPEQHRQLAMLAAEQNVSLNRLVSSKLS